ncbi:hypothetical protein QYM36_010481, partial [Artemia franciscana]
IAQKVDTHECSFKYLCDLSGSRKSRENIIDKLLTNFSRPNSPGAGEVLQRKENIGGKWFCANSLLAFAPTKAAPVRGEPAPPAQATPAE